MATLTLAQLTLRHLPSALAIARYARRVPSTEAWTIRAVRSLMARVPGIPEAWASSMLQAALLAEEAGGRLLVKPEDLGAGEAANVAPLLPDLFGDEPLGRRYLYQFSVLYENTATGARKWATRHVESAAPLTLTEAAEDIAIDLPIDTPPGAAGDEEPLPTILIVDIVPSYVIRRF